MWTVAIWFFVFLFAINGMFAYVDATFPSISLLNPLTNQTIVPAIQPNVTNTLSNLTSTTSQNATSGGAAVGIWETLDYTYNQTLFVINLLTGGFLFQALAAFGLPDLVYQIFQGVLGVFLTITILHVVTGRF